ncbi:MAG: DUF362 domain-containing protein [Desulfobacterales bacterium]|nr:MAG: DUF362 domain-containing protein [Desulfobacterales bacterium]
MGSIALIYGEQIHTMVPQLIAARDPFHSLRARDTVVIKPNLVVSRKEWQGVNTDPQVVEALVQALQARGVTRIVIGDGSGMGYSATKAFEVCGYRDMARRYGLQLVDLERDRFVRKPVPIEGPFASLEIARTVLECDFLINVPVMKAHCTTSITCSLKNLKGVMPRAMKTAFHGVDLSRAIAQLASVLVPDLILVDGIQGDLSSETGRTPVAMNRLLMGTRPVEMDSVVADMLGYPPRAIRHIAYSADAGLGTCDLQSIKIDPLNQPVQNVRLRPPPHYSQRFPCHLDLDGACCTCTGNLLFALERLKAQGVLSASQHFLAGPQACVPSGRRTMTIAVGQCAVERTDADICIAQCPPSAGTIYRIVASAARQD